MNKKIIILILVILLLVGGAFYWWMGNKKEVGLSDKNRQSMEIIESTDVLKGVLDETTKIPPPIEKSQLIFDPESGTEIVKDEILIVFKESVSEEAINKKIESINGEIIGYHKQIKQYDVKIKNNPSLEQLKKIIKQLKSDPDVDIATVELPASVFEQFALPNDPIMGSWNESKPSGKNWGLEAIYAPSAWDYNNSLTKAKIGIIEKGFYIDHEDLGLSVTNKADGDFPRFPSHASDDKEQNRNLNHGTHVAGIIGALSNNKIGVTGVVWDSELYGFNITEAVRGGSVLDGIEYLVARSISIINISLGWSSTKMAEDIIKDYQELFNTNLNKLAKNHDFLIIQGAGNDAVDAQREVLFNYAVDGQFNEVKKRVITVGAIENDNGNYQLARFEIRQGSNYGDLVDVVAPGKEIYSTLWNEDAGVSWWKFWEKEPPLTTCFDGFNNLYGCKQGTSMAAPFVTGVVGLVWGADPSLTAAQVKEIIINSADRPITYKGKEYKILNAKKSVELALGENKKLAEQKTKEEAKPSDLQGQITNPIPTTKATSTQTAQETNQKQVPPVLDKATAEKILLQALIAKTTVPAFGYNQEFNDYCFGVFILAGYGKYLDSLVASGYVQQRAVGSNCIKFLGSSNPYLVKGADDRVKEIILTTPKSVELAEIKTITNSVYEVKYKFTNILTPFAWMSSISEPQEAGSGSVTIQRDESCWKINFLVTTKEVCL